jgi:hypothetical protein
VVLLTILATPAVTLLMGCQEDPGITTYSVEEQYALSESRSVEMVDQIQFSFRLDPASVSTGRDIFFVATFANTTDYPLIFREPRQYSLMPQDHPGITLLFSVEPINKEVSIQFLGQGLVEMLVDPQADEFVTLPPQGSREIRLQLPHMVRKRDSPTALFPSEYSPLPVGQYLVQLTYLNDVIGPELEMSQGYQYVDLNTWVGKKTSDPVILTVTP